MSFLSMRFLLFLLAAVAGYYLIPKRFQWMWLLAFSYFFYLSAGVKAVIFILTTTVSTFLAGLLLEREDRKAELERKRKEDQGPVFTEEERGVRKKERTADKERTKRRKKRILAMTLLINFGILAVLKYKNFAVVNLNNLFGTEFAISRLFLPLGISFYTFQSMGYLIDVSRGKYEPDRNLFRFALFVSFFPQILQGPIGRFDRLSHQFFESHSFNLLQVERGLQLMLWGYFKKIVLADRAAVIVTEIFGNYQNYTGLMIVVGVLAYSVQLYGDFSGGMDVVGGAAECFGISLDQNFARPYFARSITDFWHRWHITLGTWMKDYVFYPLSLSKGMNKVGKYCKKRFGKQIGRVLPVCIANLVVFLLVGVWHGADWKFIVYGLYNGLIIACSNLFAPFYQKLGKNLGIRSESKGWVLVQILRTFLLVNISWYFDMASSLSAAFAMMGRTVTGVSLSVLWDGSLLTLGLDLKDYVVLGLGCVVLFAVSFLQEKHVEVRSAIASKTLAVRFGLYLLLLFSIPLLGQIQMTGGGFIYAQF